MVHWMVMGDVEPGFGLASLIVGFGLAVVATNPPEPYMGPVCFFGMTAMVVFYPWLRQNLTQRAMAKIDLEHLERLHEQVRMRPTNTGAKFRIAEMLYNRGYVSHAVGLAERLAPEMPLTLYPDENRLMRQWREAARGKIGDRPLACPRCGTYNMPGDYLCSRCGAEYLLLSAKGHWLGGFWGMKLLGAWVVAMIAVVGIPALASWGVPREAVVVGTVALMGLGAYVLLRAFLVREDEA